MEKIILDCDPGHDDAVAILMAGIHPSIELLGITTVAGNQTLNKTTINALNVCQYLNIDVPVCSGMALPMVRKVQTIADDIHGESGLDGPVFDKLTKEADKRHAVNFIIETLKNAVTLCENYPNLKTIRLDTNDGFFKQIYPTLHEFGFEIIDKDDEFHMEELSLEFPQYTFPDDLEKFYQDYPDRKNSVTIHTADLKNNLDKIATLSVNNFSSKSI